MTALAPLILAATVCGATGAAHAAGTVWDGVYSPTQVQRGGQTFAQNCAGCHGLGSREGPPWGNSFWREWIGATVRDLFNYLRDNMPNDDPGALQDSDYLDIVAYILSRNELPAGRQDLTSGTAGSIEIEPNSGPAQLPDSTLVTVTGCLTHGASGGWRLSAAEQPLRVNSDDTTASKLTAQAAQATRNFPLKFVIGSLDLLMGHTVRVKGLLIGDGGTSGINFVSASSVSDHCTHEP